MPRAWDGRLSLRHNEVVATYTVDVVSFLAQIRQYPELWDIHCEDYKYRRHRRQQAWDNIAKTFISDFDDMLPQEKESVYKALHAKWRTARDSYVRRLRNGTTKENQNIQHLSFLDKIYRDNYIIESDLEDDQSWKKMKRKRIEDNEEGLAQEDDMPVAINTRNEDALEYKDCRFPQASVFTPEDEDKSFFDSLLPAVRQFDLDQKLEFRSQIICVIKNIRKNMKIDTNL